MSSKSEFEIVFDGLREGKHTFNFQITNTFFEELTYSIITGADIRVQFVLDKKERMMIGDFQMEGTVHKKCDRCNDIMDIPLKTAHQIIYKFGNEESDDEDLIVVPPSAFTIDISTTIYELLTVALPSRTVHEEEDCNEKMLDLLDRYEGYEDLSEEDDASDEDDIDPRWDALKGLN